MCKASSTKVSFLSIVTAPWMAHADFSWLYVIEIGHTSPDPPFVKKSVGVYFPVAMQVCKKYEIIYVGHKIWLHSPITLNLHSNWWVEGTGNLPGASGLYIGLVFMVHIGKDAYHFKHNVKRLIENHMTQVVNSSGNRQSVCMTGQSWLVAGLVDSYRKIQT